MKKLHTSALLVAAASLAVSPIMGVSDVSAAAQSVGYKDFSALNSTTLDSNKGYPHSKIYWESNTTITVKKAAGSIAAGTQATLGHGLNANYIIPGQSLSVLVENSSATDSTGKKADVLIKVSDVNTWETGNDDDGNPKSYAQFSINTGISGSAAPTHPEAAAESASAIHAGDPIIFGNSTRYADSLTTVKYCKKGTYNATTDDCTAAGVDAVSAAMWDFDVPNGNREKNEDGTYKIVDGKFVYTKYGDKLLQGNEGIVPQHGVNTLYYNKARAIEGVELITEQNGFADTVINSAAFNGIWFGNSIMVTATGLSSTWAYRYTGTSCGIQTIFGSAVPYEMPKPSKTVDKSQAKVGDKVTYRISQTVPNNFTSEADIVAFMSLWSNYNSIPRSKGYSALKITDNFDNSLQLPAKSEVKIVDENGTNVTSKFTITISGQSIEAVAKTAEINKLDFYGHTYTITVPTTVKSEVAGSPVQNLAQTTYTPVDGGDTTIYSTPVETKIYHTIKAKYINDETGKEIADPTSEDYEHGKPYSTKESDNIPDKFKLIETPKDATGTADKDYEIVYRYAPPKKVTTRYIDDETGKPIGDPISEEYPQGDPYVTNPMPKVPKGYQLVKTPKNAKGTVGNKNIDVIYRYRKIKNPNTADGITKVTFGIIAATIAGFGINRAFKRRG